MFSLNGSFSGFQVSRLGFGSAGLSGVYNTPHSHEYGCSVIKEVLWKGIVLFFILMFDAELSIQMIMLH